MQNTRKSHRGKKCDDVLERPHKTHLIQRFNGINWWTGLDSNQRTENRADLQSAAFNHSATCPHLRAGHHVFA